MKLKGYIFSRPYFGERVPQHIQNIVLRDYCKKNNFTFLLSSTEYKFKNSTYIISELIDNLNEYDGIIFYSLFQLPEDHLLRKKIYNKVKKQNKELHFAVENISSKKKIDFIEIEKVYLLKLISSKGEIKKNTGTLRNFISPKHEKVKRNYINRMMNDKINCMKISKKYDYDYWDGDRKYGYGGYKYIKNYHTKLAKNLIKTYNLTNKSKLLDLGCGKGFLLYEIKKILRHISIIGLDNSKYAIRNSKPEIKKFLKKYDIKKKLSFKNDYFDLVISINTLHNLKLNNLEKALKEIERVGKKKFICVESYRNEKEQFNLQCWALTAETIIDTKAWLWLFKKVFYTGDYEFIFF